MFFSGLFWETEVKFKIDFFFSHENWGPVQSPFIWAPQACRIMGGFPDGGGKRPTATQASAQLTAGNSKHTAKEYNQGLFWFQAECK